MSNPNKPIERRNDPLVIAGFPGVGKSTFVRECNREDIIDLESSQFHDEKWPENYVKAIKEAYESHKYSYIFISCHTEVRYQLKQVGIPYIIIAPYIMSGNNISTSYDRLRLKNEYLHRYLNRGDSLAFIDKIMKNWTKYIGSIENDDATTYWLTTCYETIGSVIIKFNPEDMWTDPDPS